MGKSPPCLASKCQNELCKGIVMPKPQRQPKPEGTPQPGPGQPACLSPNAIDRSFRAVADYTYDWESWHSAEGSLLWVNPAVVRMTGYSVTECLAMEAYPLPIVAPEFRDQVHQLLRDAQNRTSGVDFDFQCLHRSGEVRWMSLCWQPMYDASHNYLGFRTSARDVTERRALREQLRLHAEHLEQLVQERTARLWQLEDRQRKMEKLASLGQLAAGIAHEINNPLAGMRNAFELFKSGVPSTHEHFTLLELIDREIERISGIIHQMYQLYRRSPQLPVPFSMDRIVEEAAFMLGSFAQKNDVLLRYSPSSALHPVRLPENEVKQILFNLIRNAIQASSAGDEVTIDIDSDGHDVTVTVRDNGPGIAVDVLPRIFEPFFSTKQSDTESGMGMGLSISSSLIEAMGGRIDVASSSSGQGSSFMAVFPSQIESLPEQGHA